MFWHPAIYQPKTIAYRNLEYEDMDSAIVWKGYHWINIYKGNHVGFKDTFYCTKYMQMGIMYDCCGYSGGDHHSDNNGYTAEQNEIKHQIWLNAHYAKNSKFIKKIKDFEDDPLGIKWDTYKEHPIPQIGEYHLSISSRETTENYIFFNGYLAFQQCVYLGNILDEQRYPKIIAAFHLKL